MGQAALAHVQLHILEPDVEELWRRLARRNNQDGETPIDRLTLENSLACWEPPDESELNQYDTHHRRG